MRFTKYFRHIAARTARNARQGNLGIILAFFSCLVILVRALAGAGFEDGMDRRIASDGNSSFFHQLRERSQQRLQDQWSRWSMPGSAFWDGVLQKEKEWHANWFSPAINAWKNKAIYIQHRKDVHDMGHDHQEYSTPLIAKDNDELPIQDHPLTDEDADLFAPEHEYAEQQEEDSVDNSILAGVNDGLKPPAIP